MKSKIDVSSRLKGATAGEGRPQRHPAILALGLAVAILALGCGNFEIKGLERDGHQAFEMGKFEEAIKKYEEILVKDPSRNDMHRYIARAQHEIFTKYIGTAEAEERSVKAIARWEKVKELFPSETDEAFKEADSSIQDILDKTGKQETGTAYYQGLVQKSPTTGNYLNLAKQLFEKELKFSEAIATLDEAAGKFPDDKWIHLTKAIYYWSWVYKDKTVPIDLRKELIAKGMEAVEKAITLDPELATPYSYRNLLYRQLAEVEPENAAKYAELSKADVEKFKALWPKEKEWRDQQAGATPPPPGS